MNIEPLDRIAYYIALLTIVSYPPGLLLWFLVHPLARWWRKTGPLISYMIMLPVLVAFGTCIYYLRGTILRIHYGFNLPLGAFGILFLICGFAVGIKRMRYLTPSIMLGIPELRNNQHRGALLTKGIYGRIRHPRYIEIGLALAGIALLVNYLAVYILLFLYIPVISIVVMLEESELRARFGDEYVRYCRDVPRFIPRLRRK